MGFLPIAAVGVLKKSASANGTTTLSVTPTAIGNCWVLTSAIASATIHISSISGGGATWQGPICGPFAGVGTQQLEMWIGTITSTSTSTITITPSASTASILESFSVQEFTAGGGVDITWALHAAQQANQASGASTVVQFPSLNGGGIDCLYYGFAQPGSTGSTTMQLSGFAFTAQLSTAGQIAIYDVDMSGVVAPGGTQSSAVASVTSGMLITATGPPTSITTVAGLQAFSGTGITTAGISASNIGDMYLVTTHINSATVHIASLACSGMTFTHVGGAVSGAHSADIWMGVITSPNAMVAAASITFTGSASIAATVNTYTYQIFSAGGQGTTWAVDGSLGTSNNTVSSTTIAYPSLTPASGGELYFGYGISTSANALTTGGTADYRVSVDGASNAVIYNLDVSGAQAPTSTQTSSAASFGIGCLISATPPAVTAIQQVGQMPASAFNATVLTTTPQSPASLGNLLVVWGAVHSSTVHFTTLSGGGVTTWTPVVGPFVGTGTYSTNMWMGVVTTAGSSTITAATSGSVSGLFTALTVQEFTLHSPQAIWSVDTTGTQSNASSATVNFPSLTPANSGEIYVGLCASGGSNVSTAVPANYTGSYNTLGAAFILQNVYNPQLGTGAQAPTITQTAATSFTIGALIIGTVPGGNQAIRVVSFSAVSRASSF